MVAMCVLSESSSELFIASKDILRHPPHHYHHPTFPVSCAIDSQSEDSLCPNALRLGQEEEEDEQQQQQQQQQQQGEVYGLDRGQERTEMTGTKTQEDRQQWAKMVAAIARTD